MAELSLVDLTKRYAQQSVLVDINLQVPSAELLALLGPSGCGKTTLLRLIAGFERPSQGAIQFDDKLVASNNTHVPPEKRRVGMVFQSYALWPHMNVAENVGYPLRVQAVARAERDSTVLSALEQVGMQDFATRAPAELSGGQRQRVALARCLVMRASVVLLDEPLANLDVHLREAMQLEFRKFHRETAATMIYVTHDQGEAMALADRVAVLDGGRLQQVDAPRKIYTQPANAMVADFVGRGTVVSGEVLGPDGPGYCAAELMGARIRARCEDGKAGQALFCLRTEQLQIATSEEVDAIETRLTDTVYRGSVTTLLLQVQNAPEVELRVDITSATPELGSVVWVSILDAWRLPS